MEALSDLSAQLSSQQDLERNAMDVLLSAKTEDTPAGFGTEVAVDEEDRAGAGGTKQLRLHQKAGVKIPLAGGAVLRSALKWIEQRKEKPNGL
eukprot:SAG11_NODE_4290_length_1967_cov_1.419165_3_plen_93_part_00